MKLLSLVQEQFDLQIAETQSPLVTARPLQLPFYRKENIEEAIQNIVPETNEQMRCHLAVSQIVIGLAIELDVSLFIGNLFEVNPQLGLCGICDYLISRSPLTFRIHPPVALIVEVKRDLERALPHCLVELVAAQHLNHSDAPIYGVLTTGLQWQFLKLEGKQVTIEQTLYELAPVDRITDMLAAMIV